MTGTAQYTSDFHFPGLLYAVPVEATIANGKITKLDTAAAEKMPGVRAIFHRQNIGKIFRSTLGEGIERYLHRTTAAVRGRCRSLLRPIRRARGGGHVSRAPKLRPTQSHVTYAKEKPNVELKLTAEDDPDEVMTSYGPAKRLQSERGDAAGAFASAPVKLDQTYVTPAETHNPIELQGTTAMWDGDKLTIYEESQGVFNMRSVLAQMFGLPKENVRVITKFVGSGFGSKLWPWTHCPLAVAAARQVGKPVKLVLSRKMTFQTCRSSRPHSAACPARRDTGRQARLAAARLRLSPLDARGLPRELR